ncbi:DrmB family protein [Sutcliffiella horikoshii]|uniref:DrmB family protein n=1 Tax=Sutcliffiella horikoshii TaxID=79883 RepID=UPI0038510BE2
MSKNQVGEVRPGQLITTFGPGAILDSVNDSLMVLDIKYWDKAKDKIFDRRLSKFLKKSYFKKIPAKGWQDLPSIPFPFYHICSNNNCRRLFDLRDKFHLETYLEEGPKCPDCEWKSYPSRFVVSCRDSNHLDDFPWRWWVHGKQETTCSGKLYMTSSGNTSSLASLGVKCECGAYENMAGATQSNSFNQFTCTGNHPHQLNKSGYCESPIIPLQRGASNVYFPALRSAISIPDQEEYADQLIQQEEEIREYEEDFGLTGLEKYFKRKLANVYDTFDDFVIDWEKYKNSTMEEVEEYQNIKEIEYAAFTDFTSKKKLKDFEAENQEIPKDLQPYFKRIIKAHRLKEILVLLGFMRNDSPEPEVNSPKNIVWLGSGTDEKWLPAVEVFGEGIFLEFNRDHINKWLSDNGVTLSSKSTEFSQLYDNWIKQKGWEVTGVRDAVYVMMHTLSHLLINQLSLQSGYSSVAIKERIYWNENMAGILLYTGSTDQEGSLGGLVEMGGTDNIRKTLFAALQEAVFCASDPHCANLEPSEENHFNGCSCFACSMIAETSCETGNRFLDRSLVVRTMDSEIKPFFDGFI